MTMALTRMTQICSIQLRSDAGIVLQQGVCDFDLGSKCNAMCLQMWLHYDTHLVADVVMHTLHVNV